MSVLSRFKDIMASNVNAMLDKMEDPSKMIDQLLRDAKSNLADVKRESANVIAQEKAAQRALDAERQAVANLTRAARTALQQGNENDAVVIAERIAKKEVEVANAEKVYAMSKQNADNMRALYKKLSADVQSLESRRANLKGLAAATRAQETVNRATSKVGNGVGSKISDFEARIQQQFDAAQAYASLDGEVADESDAILAKYSASAGASDVLAKLKDELGMNDVAAPSEEAQSILLRLQGAEVIEG